MHRPGAADQAPQNWIRRLSATWPQLTREGVLLVALVTLDLALTSHYGYFSDLAVSALGVTFALLVLSRRLPSRPPPTWLWGAVVATLGLSMLLATFSDWPQGWPVWVFVLAALAAAALVALGRNREALTVGAVGGLIFLAVCWRWDPSQIDVLYGLRSVGHAVLQGHNPYLTVHPSTTPGSPRLVHFTYGPVVAGLATIGLLLGDPRVMSALAGLGLAAALIQLARSPTEGWRLAATLAVTPLMIAMVINGWPLLLAMALIAWWLALRPQHRAAAVVVLGLAMGCALIQLGPLLLVLFLRGRRLMAEILAATGIGLLIVGVFAWWTGVQRYWYYAIGIHFQGKVGTGSLSLSGILTLLGHHPLPWFLGAVLGAAALVGVTIRPAPRLGGALTDAALVTMLAMFFAKFAYIDYYFICFAAIWLAIAAGSRAVEEGVARVGIDPDPAWQSPAPARA